MAEDHTLNLEESSHEPILQSAPVRPQGTYSLSENIEKEVNKGLFIYEDDDVVNIRVLWDNDRMTSLFAKDKSKLVAFIARIDHDPEIKAVYVQLQVLDPERLNDVPKGKGAKREHVSRYRWFVIDIDTLRSNKAKTNATDEEKEHSLLVARAVSLHLQNLGWPEPALCDSGNGWHLVWKIDLSNTQEHYQMLKSCLLALAAEFNNEHAEIDCSLAEPEQIIKLWGTMVRKGENTPLRPWRRSSVVTMPDSLKVVSTELLQQLAAQAPAQSRSLTRKRSQYPELDTDFDPEDFFEWCQENLPREYQEFFARDADADHDDADVHHYVMDGCFWAERKHSGDRRKTEFILGKTFGFNCFSDDCDGVGIGDILRKVTKLAGKMYPEQIWQQDESIFDDVDFVDEVDVREDETSESEEHEQERQTSVAGEDFSLEPQDTGNGERLVQKFGHAIRWIAETNEWMVWGRNGWRPDTKGTLMRLSKRVIEDLIAEAHAALSAAGDSEEAKQEARTLLRHARNSGRIERRKAMIASAGYERRVITNFLDWDADGWLFNCQNGIIDLRNQMFRERRQEDLCMKQSPVAYDPNATCPIWEAAMNKWMCGDADLVGYVQGALGVTLTSDTGLQALFFNQGGGENGKDTMFTAFDHVMGGYWRNVDFMTFAETKNHSEHRNDLAVLAGAIRMVTAAESSDGHSLDEGVIKQVTGCSPVTCRHIHGKPFTYVPQFKMWLMSNYEPVIKGNDWGIWRRVKKIPWNYTVTAKEKDPKLTEKLRAEASGILNWALAGLKQYIDRGYKLPPCKAVEDATAKYRKDMDIIGRFAEESLPEASHGRGAGSSGVCLSLAEHPRRRCDIC